MSRAMVGLFVMLTGLAAADCARPWMGPSAGAVRVVGADALGAFDMQVSAAWPASCLGSISGNGAVEANFIEGGNPSGAVTVSAFLPGTAPPAASDASPLAALLAEGQGVFVAPKKTQGWRVRRSGCTTFETSAWLDPDKQGEDRHLHVRARLDCMVAGNVRITGSLSSDDCYVKTWR
jgi:hypothetical protein